MIFLLNNFFLHMICNSDDHLPFKAKRNGDCKFGGGERAKHSQI